MSRNIKVPTNDAGIVIECIDEKTLVVQSYRAAYSFNYTNETLQEILWAATGVHDSWDFHNRLWDSGLVDNDRF